MAEFGFNKKKLADLLKNLKQREREVEDRVEFGLQSWALDTEAEIGRKIQQVGAIDQGQLLGATANSGALRDGNVIRITVFNNALHASVVEFGRLPGGKQPPFTPIAAWASRKGLVSLPRNVELTGDNLKNYITAAAIMKNAKKKGGGGGNNPVNKEIDQGVRDMLIIRGIQRKIAEEGTEGRFPFTKAFEVRRAAFVKEMRQYLGVV